MNSAETGIFRKVRERSRAREREVHIKIKTSKVQCTSKACGFADRIFRRKYAIKFQA